MSFELDLLCYNWCQEWDSKIFERKMPRRRQSDLENPEQSEAQDGAWRSTLIRPKEKDPQQSISDYLLYFKRIMKVNGWGNDIAGDIFIALLGPSDRVVQTLGKWTGFAELEALLLKREEPLREAHLAQLMSLKMENHELPSDLRNRVMRLVSIVYGEFSQEHQAKIGRDHFLYALPIELRQHVLAGRPKTFEETVSTAASCASLRKEDLTISSIKGSFENKGERFRVPMLCWQCGQEGHIRRFCKVRLRANSRFGAQRLMQNANLVTDQAVSPLDADEKNY